MGFQVAAVQGIEGLRSLETAWRSLTANCRELEYHQDFDWFLAYCRHAFPSCTDALHFLLLTNSSGRTLAILPLESRIEHIRRVPVRTWTQIGSRGGNILSVASSADMICHNADIAIQALRSFVSYLTYKKPPAGLLMLGRNVVDSHAWRAVSSFDTAIDFSRSGRGFSVLRTERPYTEVERSLTRDFRRKLARRGKSLRSAGVTGFEIIDSGSPSFGDAYREFLDVEASGWKGTLGTRTALQFNSEQRLFLEAVVDAGGEVKARIHRLTVAGRCVASELWLTYRASLVRLKIGYDEAYRRFGLGHLMMREALVRACADPEISRINRVTYSADHHVWGDGQFKAHHSAYLPIDNWRRFFPSLLLQLPDRERLKTAFSRAP